MAHAQRWEFESTFDELKTRQRGAGTVRRSKSPELILQEILGHLCCHYAIRTLMLEAADAAAVDPDRVQLRRRRAHRAPLDHSGARFIPQPTDHGWRHAILLCRRQSGPSRPSKPRLIRRNYVISGVISDATRARSARALSVGVDRCLRVNEAPHACGRSGSASSSESGRRA